MAVEDMAAKALCGVMEKALIAEGVSPAIAKVLAERACQPALKAASRKGTAIVKKRKPKASAYALKYGKAFKRIQKKYKKKNGSWKANGFKNAQKEAHKLAKRMR